MRLMTSAMSACTALMAPLMLSVVSTTNRMSAFAGGEDWAYAEGVPAHIRSAATAAVPSDRHLTCAPRSEWTAAADLAPRPPGAPSAPRRSFCRIHDSPFQRALQPLQLGS